MNKKIKELFCTFVLCAALFIVFAGKEAQAAAKAPSCPKTLTVYGYRNDFSGERPVEVYGFEYLQSSSFAVENMTDKAVLSNVKSSNPKISVSGFGDRVYCRILRWKAGVKDGEKAKITFTVKQDGKKYKLSCTVTFKKTKTPLASLKIENKDYASAFKGATMKGIDFPASKFKISYKSATGYKVADVVAYYKDGHTEKLERGATVDGKNIEYIEIYYTEKSSSAGGGYYRLYLYSQDLID